MKVICDVEESMTVTECIYVIMEMIGLLKGVGDDRYTEWLELAMCEVKIQESLLDVETCSRMSQLPGHRSNQEK